MHVRRTAARGAAALALSALASAPASAMIPPGTAEPDGRDSTHRVAARCSTFVPGVTSDGHVIFRTVIDGDVTEDKLSRKKLAYKVSDLGFFDFADVRGGYKMSFTAITKGRPQILSVKDLRRKPKTTFTSEPMRTKAFRPQLFAVSGSFFAVTLDKTGTVKRWTKFEDRKGRVFFGDPDVVARHAKELTTLAWTYRTRVGGVQTDVYWATTTSGGLIQLRVPVKHPERGKLIDVAKSGFEGVTDMSMGFCGPAAKLYMVAIRARADEANAFRLTDQFAPRERNLTDLGPVGEGADWDIHATS